MNFVCSLCAVCVQFVCNAVSKNNNLQTETTILWYPYPRAFFPLKKCTETIRRRHPTNLYTLCSFN